MKKQTVLTKAYQAVVAVIAVFFAIGPIQAVMFLTHIQTLSDSTFWVWYVVWQVMPFVTFAMVWAVARGTRWERLYTASMLSVAVAASSALLMTCLMWLIWPLVFASIPTGIEMYIMNGLPVVLSLSAVAIGMLWIRRQSSMKKVITAVPLVTGLAAAGYLGVSILQMGYYVLAQYPDNQNLSGFVSEFIAYGVVLLVFAVTLVVEKKRGTQKSMRASLLITLISLLAVYSGIYFVSLPLGLETPQWVAAGVITLGSVVGIFLYRWLYRTIRHIV